METAKLEAQLAEELKKSHTTITFQMKKQMFFGFIKAIENIYRKKH